MAASASNACSFPLVLLDCARTTSTVKGMRNSYGLQKSRPREAYAAVAGDVYFLTKKEGVAAPSKLSHFFRRTTLRIKCQRRADDESLQNVGRCVYMDGNQLVVSGGGCSGKAAPGSDGDEVYCISLVGAAANPETLHGLHRSIQLALVPEKVFVGLFLREPSSADVAAFQTSLQRTLSGSSGEVSNPREHIAKWAEDMNYMSRGAGLLASHVGWVSNVGKGIAEIEAGANVGDAVARGLSSVAVVGLAFAVVSVAAKGVALAAETVALKRDFESLYRGLQETGEQLLNVIIQAVGRGLRDEKVVADMVGALTEAWSISQDLERGMRKRTLRSVLRGESANEFRDKLKSRHDALRMQVSCYRSDNALRDTIVNVLSHLHADPASGGEHFTRAFRGYPSSPDVVEEALPGLAELKQSVLADSQVAVAGCRRQALATRGEGGVGKTTACVLLCNDAAVKERFPDGIHFLQFGLESSDEQVLSLLCDTLESAGGKVVSEGIRDKFKKDSGESDPLGDAADGVKAHFAGRSVLFVCDNVSHRVRTDRKRRQPLARIMQSMVADAPRACLLLTTRYADVARNIRKVVVFERLCTLEATEAVAGAQALIEKYADEDAANCARSDACQGEARDKLIAMCGGWQLLLCVCGRMVRESDGDWTKVSDLVEKDRGLLLRARPDEEDADPTLGAVLGSSLRLLDAAPAERARVGISISVIRGKFGGRCFGHLYSVLGILGDVRYVPGRLLRALFGAVRTLAKKTPRSADSDTKCETNFGDLCYVACKFLESYGLVDVVKGEGDYAVSLHDSKFQFCKDLFETGDLWTGVNVCRVHYEFVREIALSGTSEQTPLCNVDWASICGALAGPGVKTQLGWEPNLVQHLVTAARLHMGPKAANSDVVVGCSNGAAAVRGEADCEHRAVAGSAEDAAYVPRKCTNVTETCEGHTYSEEAFEWLMGLVTDLRWVRARALLDGRRGVYQDLLAVFRGICESSGCRGQRGSVTETRGLDVFCDDVVDGSHHLKGELAALKILQWVIVAASDECLGVLGHECAEHGKGGNVLCSELVGKCFDFESLSMWNELGDAARERGQARVRQFVESAEANVQGPWWKPVVRRGKELAELSETGTRLITAGYQRVFGLGQHCGLVTQSEADVCALTLSDHIGGCPEKNVVAVPRDAGVMRGCVLEGETADEGDLVAAINEYRCVFMWRVRRTVSGVSAQLCAKVSVGGDVAEVDALEDVQGMCMGRGGKVVAVYDEYRVFVWMDRQGDGGGAHVFGGVVGTGAAGKVKEVHVAKDGGAIVVLRELGRFGRNAVTCFKDAGEGEYAEAWTIEGSADEGRWVRSVAVASDSSCVYTVTSGWLSCVDVASGSESALGESLTCGHILVLLEDGARWRIVGVAEQDGDVEWWTDGYASAGTGAVRGWHGKLADNFVHGLRVRWAHGGGGGGSAGRVFESFTAHDGGVWRIRRWRVGADGRVSPADGAPPRDALASDASRGVVAARADAPKVRQFAIRHSCAEVVVAGRVEGVSVWDVRTGARTGVLAREGASAVDVSADGSIAVTARWTPESTDGSVDVWDLCSRDHVAVLAGYGENVYSLLLCDGGGGGGGGGRLWVVAGGFNGTLRVGDCRTGEWLHQLDSGQNAIASLGYAVPQSCAWHQHERTASATAPVAPAAGTEPAMHAWIASEALDGDVILWQLSCDGKLTKNPTQPAESDQEEHTFDNVFSKDNLSIQDWRQVPCGEGGLAVAGDAEVARFAGHVAASYSFFGAFWLVDLDHHPSLADCSCPPVVLGSTHNRFSFVSMPRAGDAAGASDLAAVTVDTDDRLQIWHLNLSGG